MSILDNHDNQLIAEIIDENNKLKHRCEILDDMVKANTHESFHRDAYIETLHEWIKSDSVYTLLRYGFKSPSSSGVDDCEEQRLYIQLYNLSVSLRKNEKEENEARQDDFHQKLP